MRASVGSMLVALGCLGLGCQLHPTFTTGYSLDPQTQRASPVEGSLAVRTFAEERPPRVYSTSGRMFLT